MQPFQPSAAPPPNASALAGWMANPNPSSSVPSGVVAASPFPMQPNQGRFHVPTSVFWFSLFDCHIGRFVNGELILRPENPVTVFRHRS